jgi:hypothetical protein
VSAKKRSVPVSLADGNAPRKGHRRSRDRDGTAHSLPMFDSTTTPHVRLYSFPSSPPSQVTYRETVNEIRSKIKK